MAEAQAAKPNIYLYPQTRTEVDVALTFPEGGFVTTSIPDYGNGWHVTIDPDGTIDNTYGFLFYESQNPDFYQYAEGWTVQTETLEHFFRENLTQYGFKGREIEDFIEWWIPRLKDEACYDIYPQINQEIDPVIELSVTPRPDNILRLFYVVKKSRSNLCETYLAQPAVTPFIREGFSVTEWGVIQK